MAETPVNRDLLVPPGSHAFVQKVNTGEISTFVGPKAVTFSGQEHPVRFDDNTNSFIACERHESLRKNVSARQGQYVVLENPAFERAQEGKIGPLLSPTTNSNVTHSAPDMAMGKRVVVRGPVDFALWPRQKATVVDGHQLRSNQYLEAIVIDPVAAKENWQNASVVVANQITPDPKADPAAQPAATQKPLTLTVGQRLIIKGTEVSFYIPPTGIEIAPNIDESEDEHDNFTRHAVTLERLECCILVDENGKKRYEQGPQVVFPSPTERFVKTSDGKRKFRAIELPQKAGLHVKVISDYSEETSEGVVEHKIGDEIFITGEKQSIYYPREEHSIISYGDGQSKIHYGVAIPKGEGRYVMNRLDGKISIVTGPTILLCDPRKEVIVRRVLSDRQCEDWYPKNSEVISYNRSLRQIQQSAGSSNSVRNDAIDESLLTKSMSFAASYSAPRSIESSSKETLTEEFRRGSNYSPPRSITLNTKFEGIPTIEIWSGYAVQVVSKSGERRVETGPQAVLLNYDETLEIMTLSTGKPKSTDTLMRTVYLRTQNNKVSDVFPVETRDHVICEIKLSFEVNFDPLLKDKWFSCENYVKLLCDHVRSVIKGEVKKKTIEDFYANAAQIVRDTILGVKPAPNATGSARRSGMAFEQNGMKIDDVEILGVEIKDAEISKILNDSQRKAVQTNIEMANRERDLVVVEQSETIERKKMEARAATEKRKSDFEIERIGQSLAQYIEKASADLKQAQEKFKILEATNKNDQIQSEAVLEIKKMNDQHILDVKEAEFSLESKRLEDQTKAIKERFQSASGNFVEAMALLCREENAVKVAQAASWNTVIGGKSLEAALMDIFGKDSPIAAAVGGIMQRKGVLDGLPTR